VDNEAPVPPATTFVPAVFRDRGALGVAGPGCHAPTAYRFDRACTQQNDCCWSARYRCAIGAA